MNIDNAMIITVARDLRSEDGENPEYDRALVEMTTRLLGLSHEEDGPSIARLILR